MTQQLKNTISIDENDANERLDTFLASVLENVSRSKIQKFVEDGKILLNGKNTKNSYKLRENDVVSFDLQEENFVLSPEKIPLDIKYEDDDMLVVNKPKNMLVHPSASEFTGTLVNALLGYCSDTLSDLNGSLRPGIVHRLDRNTTGLIMVAKNNAAHKFLADEIKNHRIEKKYRAVVCGVVENDDGKIDLPIGRNKKNPQKMCVTPDGKPSYTEYHVLERFPNHTYLELGLVTGRTHQLRVHLSSINHPIVNDSLYSGIPFKVKTTEQVLQSFHLKFAKPDGHRIIEIEIEPDEDIQKVLNYLRSKK